MDELLLSASSCRAHAGLLNGLPDERLDELLFSDELLLRFREALFSDELCRAHIELLSKLSGAPWGPEHLLKSPSSLLRSYCFLSIELLLRISWRPLGFFFSRSSSIFRGSAAGPLVLCIFSGTSQIRSARRRRGLAKSSAPVPLGGALQGGALRAVSLDTLLGGGVALPGGALQGDALQATL